MKRIQRCLPAGAFVEASTWALPADWGEGLPVPDAIPSPIPNAAPATATAVTPTRADRGKRDSRPRLDGAGPLIMSSLMPPVSPLSLRNRTETPSKSLTSTFAGARLVRP